MCGFDSTIKFYGDDTDTARRLSKFGRVVFDMSFYIFTSGRRFEKSGFIKTNIIYGINFIWPVIFHRPFTSKYSEGYKLNK
ncbi:hypothetical protein IT397_01265 [Candidatus Nomurabacteria bacterium]|nr:hypothetical protein [Candidatus Nomurabacteria bacterium]